MRIGWRERRTPNSFWGPEMRSANRSDLSCPQHSISKRYGWLKLVLRYLPKMSPLNKVTLFLHFCYTNISQPYISGVRNTFGRKLRKCVRRTVRADLRRRSLHSMIPVSTFKRLVPSVSSLEQATRQRPKKDQVFHFTKPKSCFQRVFLSA